MPQEYTEAQKQEVLEMFNSVGISATIKHFKGRIGMYTIRSWCVPGWKEERTQKTTEYRAKTHTKAGQRKYSEDFKNDVRAYYIRFGLEATIQTYRDQVWPETIKYWCKAEHQLDVKQAALESYNENKSDPEFLKKRAEASREFRKTEHGKEYIKKYQEENYERYSENAKRHRAENLERYTILTQLYYTLNKERLNALNKIWYQANKDKLRKIELTRYHSNPITKISSAIRVGVRRALKYAKVGKEHPSIIYLGCDIETFKAHIEKQFKEGMSWENHGDWHLDHIKPLSILSNIEDVEVLKELCHYTNYQPLWKEENLSKYNKTT